MKYDRLLIIIILVSWIAFVLAQLTIEIQRKTIMRYANLVIRDVILIPSPSIHTHTWGLWSEPEVTSGWFNGTRLWQKRICVTCGEAEMRTAQVSPNGK